ncbi:unnamed protein product [Dibothriocephalus latus]|uniref:CCDC66 domain-containing protein n=1 Tax=Dibothriocephalus latus TaxID=60516 RepID=A0A3P7M3F2_DIBLA|nr:unnamed protein product [Dibothriocephalus latus]
MTAFVEKNMERSDNENFHFLQFRNHSAEKERKKRQLNLDYQKFKEEEEEKFRNRFADKKRPSDYTQIKMQARIGNESDTDVRASYTTQPAEHISNRDTPDHVTGGLEVSQPGGIEKLIFDKINGLQNSIEELKSFKQDRGHFPANAYNRYDMLDVVPGQQRYLMETSGQRHPHLTQISYDGYNERFAIPVPQTQSVNSVGLVDEAERKLQELEALLSMLKGGERYPGAPKMAVYPDTRSPQERSPIKFTGKSDSELFRNPIVGESTGNNFERGKKQSKQNLNAYALELQKQIEDGKRRKEEQRQLELEADRKKEKEMSLYDQFGHRLTNPPSEALTKTEESIHQDRVKPGVSTMPGNTPTFARGGNGVFGQPLTQSQKEENDKYRKELEEQIAERKRREEEEKQRKEEEEKRDLERIEVERKKIAEELAAEKLKNSQQCRVFESDPQPPSPEPEHAPEKNTKCSLNLDELTYRNHERLKKLDALNYSLEVNGDSEEVLREFLSQEEARQCSQRNGITKGAEL